MLTPQGREILNKAGDFLIKQSGIPFPKKKGEPAYAAPEGGGLQEDPGPEA